MYFRLEYCFGQTFRYDQVSYIWETGFLMAHPVLYDRKIG